MSAATTQAERQLPSRSTTDTRERGRISGGASLHRALQRAAKGGVEAQEALLRPRESDRLVERATSASSTTDKSGDGERCPGCGGAMKPAAAGGTTCASCGKEGGGAGAAKPAAVQQRRAAVQLRAAAGTPVQRLGLGDVIPDGLMSQLRSLASSASDFVSGLGERAESAVAQGETEGGAVPAEADGRIAEGVAQGEGQVADTTAQVHARGDAAATGASGVADAAGAKAAELEIAAPVTSHALDPVRSKTEPAPVPQDTPPPTPPAPEAVSEPQPGSGGGPPPVVTPSTPMPDMPAVGGASGPPPDIAKGVASGKAEAPGKWNCDTASVVKMVSDAADGAADKLAEVGKAVIPEDVLRFAEEQMGWGRARVGDIVNRTQKAVAEDLAYLEEQTRPYRQAAQEQLEIMSSLYESGKALVQDKIAAVEDWASKRWEGLKSTVSAQIDDAVKWAKDQASGILSTARNMAGTLWKAVPDFIRQPIENAVGAVAKGVDAARAKIARMADKIGEWGANLAAMAQAAADRFVQYLAREWESSKAKIAAVLQAIESLIAAAREKVSKYAKDAFDAIDELSGGALSRWGKAAAKKYAELKGDACGVIGDVAGPCIERALPDPGKDNVGKANLATQAEITVPLEGVPVKVAAGAALSIERSGKVYKVIMTGEGFAGVSANLAGGSNAGLSTTIDGTLPAKVRGMRALGSSLPIVMDHGAPGGGGGADKGADKGAPGGADTGASGGKTTPGATGSGAGAGGKAPASGGGHDHEALGELGRKLKVEATYTFDASAKNTCDGLGGLAMFLGAHGGATALPYPFATMARGATSAAFAGNLSGLKVTNAVTGKLVAGADIAGFGKVGSEVGGEAGVTVGMEKVERTDPKTKDKLKDTVLSAALYATLSGKAAVEMTPSSLPILKGEAGGSATSEASISYNLGTEKVDAGLKQTVVLGYSLQGFAGIMSGLSSGARASIKIAMERNGIDPGAHEGVVQVELATEMAHIATLAAAIDQELAKGEGATADGVWAAVKRFLASADVATTLKVTLEVSKKLVGAKVEGNDGKGTRGQVGVDVKTGKVIQLYAGPVH